VCFGDLGRLLGPDQPVYGLQARGLEDREAPFERIEPMAAHYVAEIRKFKARGPYRIGGTCFGGVVAYEMAQQLRAAGDEVDLLFLLETWPPPPPRPLVDALQVRSHRLRFVVSALQRNLAAMRQMAWPQRLRALLAGLKIVAEMLARRDLYRGDSATMYVDQVSLANQRALLHYQPRPYEGAVRSAIAALRSFTGEDSRCQWRTLAPRDYAQVDLPVTDSGTMLIPPCVAPLAAWMRDTLATRDAQLGAAPGRH
jgi:thioesterase domain-containing protein